MDLTKYNHDFPAVRNAHRPFVLEEQGTLSRHWDALRRRIWTVVAITAAVSVLTLLFVLPRTPMYQGKAKLEIQGLNENFLNLHDVNPNASSSGSGSIADTFMQTQIEVLQSDSLLERVIGKLNLLDTPEFSQPSRISKTLARMGIKSSKKPTVQSILPQVSKNLLIRPTRQTSIIEVTYDSSDPRTAADFTNTLISEYMEQELQFRFKQSQHTREWLGGQLSDSKKQLEKSEREWQTYARDAGLLFTSETNNVAEEKLRQIQAELSKVQADRMAQESLYNMAISNSADSLPAVLDNGPLREYQMRLADLRRQRADLNSTLTPRNSRVLRLDAQIAELEATLVRERGNVVNRIKNEFEAAKERENLLSKAYSRQTQILSAQGSKGIRYNTLKREVESNRSLYEGMLQKVKEAGVASAIQPSSVRVVDPARTPENPYKPKKLLDAGLGVLAGLILSLSFIVVREGTDRTFHLPGRSRSYLNVPELGVVPSHTSQGQAPVSRATRTRSIRSHVSSIYGDVTDDSADLLDLKRTELAALASQSPAMTDSFRAIVTSILFSAGSAPHVIALSSPNPGEGKTTMVSNLSIVLAKIGHRVLIIDADSRRPKLHDIFKVDQTPGLTDMLHDLRHPASDFTSFVKPTGITGLSLLPGGTASDDLATTLFSKKTANLLAQAKKQYDTILIDTPPMLFTPEARILGRLADAVVLIVRASRTTKDDALTCTERLAEDRTPLLGTILNDWKGETNSYGYYTAPKTATAKAG